MNTIQMCANLYDARDSMKKFYGDEYVSKVSAYVAFLGAAMKRFDCDELQALIRLLKELQSEEPYTSCIAQEMLKAALVEMTELNAT